MFEQPASRTHNAGERIMDAVFMGCSVVNCPWRFAFGFRGLVETIHAFFIGSEATMRKVAIGPRSNDRSHQFRPILPFACARPALMRESVNHPTAY